MTATTVDRAAKYYEGLDFGYPIYTATTIPEGAAVNLNASGYAVSTTNTAGEVFVGVCQRHATSVEGGPVPVDVNVRVRRKGVHSFVTSGAGLTTPGTDMYFADNQTVQTTPTSIYAGKFVKYTSATEALIDISYATCGLSSVDDADEIVSLPVAATTSIALNDLVFSTATGYATPGATTAGLKLEGIALAAANNSGGADGAISVSVKRKTAPVTHLTTTGAALTDEGKSVWASGAQAVSLTAGNNRVGTVTKYISATSVYISLLSALGKARPGSGDTKSLMFTRATLATTPGTDVAKFQLPRKSLVTAMYLTLVTAPGGSDTCTATYSDGTTTETAVATGAAKVGTATPSGTPIKAATDITVNFLITGATAAGATLVVEYEEL